MASANRSARREVWFCYTRAIQVSHRRTTCEIQYASIFYTRTFVPKIWCGGREINFCKQTY